MAKCPNCGTEMYQTEGFLLDSVWECPKCLMDGDKQCRFDNYEVFEE